jgi:hypothetical protein
VTIKANTRLAAGFELDHHRPAKLAFSTDIPALGLARCLLKYILHRHIARCHKYPLLALRAVILSPMR